MRSACMTVRQPVGDQHRDHVRPRRHVAHRAADLLLGERVERAESPRRTRAGADRAAARGRSTGAASRRRRSSSRPRRSPCRAPCRRAAAAIVAAGLPQHVEALLVGRARAARRAGSRESCPLNSCASCVTKPMRSRKRSRSSSLARHAVVENAALRRAVQADEQLHERRLARARRADERDRLAAVRLERDVRRAPASFAVCVREAHVRRTRASGGRPRRPDSPACGRAAMSKIARTSRATPRSRDTC